MSGFNALFSANAQWANDVDDAQPGFFQQSAKGQTPHTLWIGCADSRVPESVLLGARPGDIFVHRNIAKFVLFKFSFDSDSDLSESSQFPLNDVNSEAVLEYAVNHLHVRNVVVVGHTECGGAAACLNAAQRPTFPEDGQLLTIPSLPYTAPLNQWLEPLTKLVGTLGLTTTPKDEALPVVVEENVKLQVENLCKTATIQDAWASSEEKKRNVRVHGWVYNLSNGLLKDLEITRGPAA
ncbi:hypothetical protein H0H93_011703 [Arthromyces matolae]|nr:hypothetical protein H0H93_011703 [Arthromyces matolae]